MKRRILIIIMLLCAVGIYVFSVRSNNEYAKDACRLDSLPTLTTTEQILEAVNSPSEKRYVICDYKFPKVESVADPYDNLSRDSGYVYIFVNVYQYPVGHSSHRYASEHEISDLHKSLRGRLFFDENTELLGFDKAFVAEAPSHHRVNFSGSRKRYEYNYLPSDAKLSFIAILGNNKAQFTGLDNGTSCILGNIVEGDKAQLADWSSDGGGLYSFAAFLCGVVFVCLGLFLLVDYIKSKKNEKK
ncbi:MAG: hypothetical protein J6T60_04415 [Bacteroidales bacterium]|nr:hypothetical protein [Bacteroidales bacterium]